MPELPEVETTKRGIEAYLVDQTVHTIVVRQPKLRWPISPEIVQLQSQRILSLSRRGKYIGVHFETGTLIIHLGMSGSLYLVTPYTEPLFHDHVDIQLPEHWLRYTDPRRFGAMLWHQGDWQQHPLLAHLGPEPLTADFDADYLARQATGRKRPIKTFIMDSQVVVGVGNIYANEALFMAQILPNCPAGALSVERLQRLVAAIKQVLANAIEQGGTTLKDFVGGDGKPGYFKQSLMVYGRSGLPCLHCETPLVESRLGQRSTVFCPQCQVDGA
jgi:formamidopyrimidine-DNA glycosylase